MRKILIIVLIIFAAISFTACDLAKPVVLAFQADLYSEYQCLILEHTTRSPKFSLVRTVPCLSQQQHVNVTLWSAIPTTSKSDSNLRYKPGSSPPNENGCLNMVKVFQPNGYLLVYSHNCINPVSLNFHDGIGSGGTRNPPILSLQSTRYCAFSGDRWSNAALRTEVTRTLSRSGEQRLSRYLTANSFKGALFIIPCDHPAFNRPANSLNRLTSIKLLSLKSHKLVHSIEYNYTFTMTLQTSDQCRSTANNTKATISLFQKLSNGKWNRVYAANSLSVCSPESDPQVMKTIVIENIVLSHFRGWSKVALDLTYLGISYSRSFGVQAGNPFARQSSFEYADFVQGFQEGRESDIENGPFNPEETSNRESDIENPVEISVGDSETSNRENDIERPVETPIETPTESSENDIEYPLENPTESSENDIEYPLENPTERIENLLEQPPNLNKTDHEAPKTRTRNETIQFNVASTSTIVKIETVDDWSSNVGPTTTPRQVIYNVNRTTATSVTTFITEFIITSTKAVTTPTTTITAIATLSTKSRALITTEPVEIVTTTPKVAFGSFVQPSNHPSEDAMTEDIKVKQSDQTSAPDWTDNTNTDENNPIQSNPSSVQGLEDDPEDWKIDHILIPTLFITTCIAIVLVSLVVVRLLYKRKQQQRKARQVAEEKGSGGSSDFSDSNSTTSD